MAQQINENIDITPVTQDPREDTTVFFTAINNGISPNTKPIQSPNYKTNTMGWRLDSSGASELNGSVTVSTNFRIILEMKGLTLYVSNGTTPNGNLSGTAGDICFGADSGKAYYCTGTTSWTAM